MKKVFISLVVALCAGLLTGCASFGLSEIIKEAAKDPAKARLEFSGWNAHLVYERDNSLAALGTATNTAPLEAEILKAKLRRVLDGK